MTHYPHSQRGAALVTALIVMLIILLLATTAARFSTSSLRQAINEEIRTAANLTAQSVVDGALLDGANVAVRGTSGDSNCTPNYGETCTRNEINLPSDAFGADVLAGSIKFRSRRGFPALIPPPRGMETSTRAFDAAPFELNATFNKSSENLGQAEVHEGLILLVPKY